MFDEYFKILISSFSEENAYRLVEKIYKNDCWNCFSKYKKTAVYCAELLESAGLEEIELLPVTADGKSTYYDWAVPRAWDAAKGKLTLPAHTSAFNEELVIADYQKVPCSLMMYSASTPPGGIDVEVLEFEASSNVSNECLKGKLLFTRNSPGTIIKKAVEGEAAGIISDYLPYFTGIREDSYDISDACRWENSLLCPENNTGIFGFSISKCMAIQLRNLISDAAKTGKRVILHAEVETEFSDGEVYTVSGVIRGTDPEAREIMICGHLYEPGANDNATGCGMMLELARTICRGINEGTIAKPYCNIRFIMGFECVGILACFQKHKDWMSRIVGAINVDMVGSIPEERAALCIWHNPLSNWSFADTLILEIISSYQLFFGEELRYDERDFNIGDNLLSDPSLGIPTIALLMHPALSYHTSADNMSRVSPLVLKHNAIIVGTFLLFLSSMDSKRITWILDKICIHAKKEIIKGSKRGETYISLLCEAFYQGCMRLQKVVLSPNQENIKKIVDVAEGIRMIGKPLNKESISAASEYQSQSLVPYRKIPGPLTFHPLSFEIRKSLKWDPFYNYSLNCPLFWVDGFRNLEEIAKYTAAELDEEFNDEFIENLQKYFDLLKKYNYIAYLC